MHFNSKIFSDFFPRILKIKLGNPMALAVSTLHHNPKKDPQLHCCKTHKTWTQLFLFRTKRNKDNWGKMMHMEMMDRSFTAYRTE
jgi:hypothetical protein